MLALDPEPLRKCADSTRLLKLDTPALPIDTDLLTCQTANGVHNETEQDLLICDLAIYPYVQ